MASKIAQAIVIDARRKKNIVEKQQDAERYASLDTDKEVQKRWNDYEKIIGPKSTKMSKEYWYDFNYKKHKAKISSSMKDYAARSKRTAEANN